MAEAEQQLERQRLSRGCSQAGGHSCGTIPRNVGDLLHTRAGMGDTEPGRSHRTELALTLPSTQSATIRVRARREQWGQGRLLVLHADHATDHGSRHPRQAAHWQGGPASSLSICLFFGKRFQPWEIKQDRGGGMAKSWQTQHPAPPLHPTLQHLPGGSTASCSPHHAAAAPADFSLPQWRG